MNQTISITQSFELSPPMVEILLWLTEISTNPFGNRLTYYSGELDQKDFSQEIVDQLNKLGLLKYYGLSCDLSVSGKLVTDKLKNQ
ncbi:MAG: hypothetical protein WC437_05490 [Patescibacteria group bacterium]|jgi:hypothetical protein